jgi:hypothetical protein
VYDYDEEQLDSAHGALWPSPSNLNGKEKTELRNDLAAVAALARDVPDSANDTPK